MAYRMSATRLRAELFKALDQVVSNGEAVKIERPGGSARMVLAASGSHLSRLSLHPPIRRHLAGSPTRACDTAASRYNVPGIVFLPHGASA